MIKTDRKLKNTIIKFKPTMNDYMKYDYTSNEIQLFKPNDLHKAIRSITVSISPDQVDYSIQRLIDIGYLSISQKVMGGYFFSITGRFVLRHEFAIESFSKKFWCGFISGIITSVIGGLLTLLIQMLLGL